MGRAEDHASARCAEGTVKRLDFEHIPVSMPDSALHEFVKESHRIRRGLDECRAAVSEPKELIDASLEAAKQFDGIDLSKLREIVPRLTSEILLLEAENHFLSSLASEGDPTSGDATEEELESLQKQALDLSSRYAEECQEIEPLIHEFVAEMESFGQTMETALNCIKSCDEKISSWKGQKVPQKSLQFKSHSNWKSNDVPSSKDNPSDTKELEEELALLKTEAAELECGQSKIHLQAHELLKSTENVETEILGLENDILLQEKYFERLSLPDVLTKLDLFNAILKFYNWQLGECENGEISFVYNSLFPASEENGYAALSKGQNGVRIRLDETTLAIEDVKLTHTVPIDDVLEAMRFSRKMHSLGYSLEPHNDLEFLLRKIGQQISLMKESSMLVRMDYQLSH